jgi:hypothetical protein
MVYLDAGLAKLERELLQIRAAAQHCRQTIRTLSIGLAGLPVDDRDVLQMTAELRVSAETLKVRLGAVNAATPGMSRAVHRRGSSSSFGRLGNVRGTSRQVEKELTSLHDELTGLQRDVSGKVNDPGRWGNAALVSGPLVELIGLLELVIELFGKHIEKQKRTS